MAQNVQNDVVRTIFKNKGWCGRAETGIRSPPRHYPNPPTLRQTTSLSLFGTTLLKPKLSSRRGSDESCLLLRGQISLYESPLSGPEFSHPVLYVLI